MSRDRLAVTHVLPHLTGYVNLRESRRDCSNNEGVYTLLLVPLSISSFTSTKYISIFWLHSYIVIPHYAQGK